MSDKKRVIGSFEKSPGKQIRLSLVDWQGKSYLDIRECLQPDPELKEAVVYTSKGIRIRADLTEELMTLLDQSLMERK